MVIKKDFQFLRPLFRSHDRGRMMPDGTVVPMLLPEPEKVVQEIPSSGSDTVPKEKPLPIQHLPPEEWPQKKSPSFNSPKREVVDPGPDWFHRDAVPVSPILMTGDLPAGAPYAETRGRIYKDSPLSGENTPSNSRSRTPSRSPATSRSPRSRKLLDDSSLITSIPRENFYHEVMRNEKNLEPKVIERQTPRSQNRYVQKNAVRNNGFCDANGFYEERGQKQRLQKRHVMSTGDLHDGGFSSGETVRPMRLDFGVEDWRFENEREKFRDNYRHIRKLERKREESARAEAQRMADIREQIRQQEFAARERSEKKFAERKKSLTRAEEQNKTDEAFVLGDGTVLTPRKVRDPNSPYFFKDETVHIWDSDVYLPPNMVVTSNERKIQRHQSESCFNRRKHLSAVGPCDSGLLSHFGEGVRTPRDLSVINSEYKQALEAQIADKQRRVEDKYRKEMHEEELLEKKIKEELVMIKNQWELDKKRGQEQAIHANNDDEHLPVDAELLSNGGSNAEGGKPLLSYGHKLSPTDRKRMEAIVKSEKQKNKTGGGVIKNEKTTNAKLASADKPKKKQLIDIDAEWRSWEGKNPNWREKAKQRLEKEFEKEVSDMKEEKQKQDNAAKEKSSEGAPGGNKDKTLAHVVTGEPGSSSRDELLLTTLEVRKGSKMSNKNQGHSASCLDFGANKVLEPRFGSAFYYNQSAEQKRIPEFEKHAWSTSGVGLETARKNIHKQQHPSYYVHGDNYPNEFERWLAENKARGVEAYNRYFAGKEKEVAIGRGARDSANAQREINSDKFDKKHVEKKIPNNSPFTQIGSARAQQVIEVSRGSTDVLKKELERLKNQFRQQRTELSFKFGELKSESTRLQMEHNVTMSASMGDIRDTSFTGGMGSLPLNDYAAGSTVAQAARSCY